MNVALLAIALTPGGSTDWQEAQAAYQTGVMMRDDASSARPWFRLSAELMDQLPDRSHHEIALARVRAHYLAGEWPMSLVACHEGLKSTPGDPELNQELDFLRARLPPECYFPRSWWWRTFSRRSWFIISALAMTFWCFTRVMITYSGRGYPQLATLVLFLSVAGLSAHYFMERSHRMAPRLGVVLDETVLRTGNGTSYPNRLAELLPAGSELQLVHERGGWFQVRTPTGAIGWLPQESVFWLEQKISRRMDASPDFESK